MTMFDDYRTIPVKKIIPQCVKRKRSSAFLRGPIPLAWLEVAARLPGKAYLVATILWWQAGVCMARQDLILTQGMMDRFGVSRQSKYQSLAALSQAGLIQVSTSPGKNPRVTILDVKDEGDED